MEHKSFMYRSKWVTYDRDEMEYSINLSDATVTFTSPQSAREFIDEMIEKGESL